MYERMYTLHQEKKQTLWQLCETQSYCHPANQHWDVCTPLSRVQAKLPGAGLVTCKRTERGHGTQSHSELKVTACHLSFSDPKGTMTTQIKNGTMLRSVFLKGIKLMYQWPTMLHVGLSF